MYTLIVMHRERTDKQPLTVHVSRALLLMLVLFFVGVPFAGFWLAYRYIAPQQFQADIESLETAKVKAVSQLQPLKDKSKSLIGQVNMLKGDVQKERNMRAEAEARATMAENAKVTSSQQVSKLEQELISLRQSIKFYENLVQPNVQKDIMQCFNIKAELSGKKLTYGINFMKNNQKNKDKVDVKVELRVLQGSDTLELGKVDVKTVKPATTRKFALTKDYRLTGKIDVNVHKNQLHLLDIRAFDAHNKSIARCWKAF